MSTSKQNLGLLYAIAATIFIIGVGVTVQSQLEKIDVTTLEPIWANAVLYAKTITFSTELGGGIMFIFGMYGYLKNRALAQIQGTNVAFNFNYYMMTFAAILGELGATMVSTQTRPDLQQLGQGIVVFANIIKSVLGDLFGNQSSAGIPQPPTPSTIPPIPGVPATVMFTGAGLQVNSVMVDGKPYSLSTAGLNPGQYSVGPNPAGTEMDLGIDFPDYLPHAVNITYAGNKTLSLVLTSGSKAGPY